MTRVPSAVWIVDTKKEHIAVGEARKLDIPVVAILDTNCDPDEVDYKIPGNDDAIRSVTLLTRVIADAVAEGLMARVRTQVDGDEKPEGLARRRAAGRVGAGAAPERYGGRGHPGRGRDHRGRGRRGAGHRRGACRRGSCGRGSCAEAPAAEAAPVAEAPAEATPAAEGDSTTAPATEGDSTPQA